MSRRPQLTQWHQELTGRFPDLPSSVVLVLAVYSFGMLAAHVSGLTTVSFLLAKLFAWSYNAVRKRLREFYQEAQAKSGVHQGVKRRDFAVATCFPPLLRWLLSLWQGKMLPLAIDVTNLGDRFHVLCISVVVRGIGIPVAWKVLPAGVPDPWNPHWQNLLTALKPAVPEDWLVTVLSDRGLESADLFRFVVTLGWHPLMRLKKGCQFRPKGWGKFYPLTGLVSKIGSSFQAEGCAYTSNRLASTLLARWDEGYQEPWFVLTDLPAETAEVLWYGLRSWIEQGFKIIKGGMWDWQKTRMADPGRVERLWLVLAVATVWVVALGAEDEVREQNAQSQKRQERELNETLEQAKRRHEQEAYRQQKQQEERQRRQERQRAQQQAREKARADRKGKKHAQKEQSVQETRKKASQTRMHRVSRRGLAVLEELWSNGKNRLPQHLYPEPWPAMTHSVSTFTEEEFLAQQKYP
jgi:hypothetical protein